MALALLCSKLPASVDHLTRLRLQAFIVDHGARAGSSAEAKSVSEILRDKGELNPVVMRYRLTIKASIPRFSRFNGP
jgi:hypothetical protein